MFGLLEGAVRDRPMLGLASSTGFLSPSFLGRTCGPSRTEDVSELFEGPHEELSLMFGGRKTKMLKSEKNTRTKKVRRAADLWIAHCATRSQTFGKTSKKNGGNLLTFTICLARVEAKSFFGYLLGVRSRIQETADP